MLNELRTHYSEDRALARSLLYQAIGLDLAAVSMPPPTHLTRWTRSDILESVVRFVDAHERLPTDGEWRRASDHGLPSRATVQLQWGKLSVLRNAVMGYLRKRKENA